MLARVRQRLLHDPVGGEVDAGREALAVPLDAELDRQARTARLLDEPAEIRDPGLGGERRLASVVAEDPEDRGSS